MTIPIEFEVAGKPSSVNGKTKKRKVDWQTDVAAAGLKALTTTFGAPPPAPYAGEVTVKLFFCPHNEHYLDIDNGVKHTVDAISQPKPHVKLSPVQYVAILNDDKTAFRLIVERFPKASGASLIVKVGVAATLAKALQIVVNKKKFGTAIKVEEYISNGGSLW